MTISNGYGTLAGYKVRFFGDTTDTSDDEGLLEPIIEATSRLIDNITDRRFYASTELVDNGGMEGTYDDEKEAAETMNVAPGWTKYAVETDGTDILDESTDAHSGSKAQQINVDADFEGIATDANCFTANKWHLVTVWAKRTTGDLQVRDGAYKFLTESFTPSASYSEHKFVCFATVATTLKVTSSGGAANCLVDDVSVKAIQTRYYTPLDSEVLFVDDLLTVGTLKTDGDGDRTYETTWDTGDYDLMPLNSSTDVAPYTWIEIAVLGDYTFPIMRASVELAGDFGYCASTDQPTPITEALYLGAHRAAKRLSTPLGVSGSPGTAQISVEVEALRFDPDFMGWLDPYIRKV